MRLLTIPALVVAGASLLVLGGVVFALILFFPLFLLGLGAVLAGLEDRTVQQHDPSMDATKWRRGSHAASSEPRSPVAAEVARQASDLDGATRRAA
jgi:hypothetical protein